MPDPFDLPALDDDLMPGSLRRLRDRGGLQKVRDVDPRIDPNETDGEPSYFLDGLMGIPRGVEGLVRSLYSLADVVSGDLLWDWDDESRLFGKSETWVGGLTEGITQFLTAFIPVAGWVGRGAQIGGRAVPGLARLGKAAETSTLASFGKAAAAGAIADFTAFQGHEKRLSNLIQAFPALENPITDYLQAEGDEDNLAGRFKATLEGFGLGALVDGLVHVVRAIRSGKKAGKDADKAFTEALDEDLVQTSIKGHEDTAKQAAAEAATPTSLADEAAVGSLDSPLWRRPDEGKVTGDIYEVLLGDEAVRVRKSKGRWVDEETGRVLGKTQAEVERSLRTPRREVTMEKVVMSEAKDDIRGTTKDGKVISLKKEEIPTTKRGKPSTREVWQGEIDGVPVTLRSAFFRGKEQKRLVLRYFTAGEGGTVRGQTRTHLVDVNTTKQGPTVHEGTAGELPFALRRDAEGNWAGTVGDEGVKIRRDKGMWVDAESGQQLGRTKAGAMRKLVERQNLRAAGRAIEDQGRASFEGVGELEGANSLEIVTTEQLEDIVEVAAKELEQDLAAVNPRNLTPEELVVSGLKRNDINLARLGKEPAAMVRAVARIFRDMRMPKEALHVSHPELEKRAVERLNEMLGILAKDSSADPHVPLGLMVDKHLEEGVTLLEKTMAWRVMLTQSAEDTVSHAAAAVRAADGATQKEALAKFIQSVDATAQALRAVKGATAIQGRALQSNNIPFRNIETLLEMLEESGKGKADAINLAKKIEALGDSPSGIFQLVEHAQTSGLFKMLTEYWMNAILSGGKTLFVNGLGGLLLTVYRPFEKLMGGLARGDPNFQVAMAEFARLWTHVGQSMRAAWESTKTGDPLLLASGRTKAGDLGLGTTRFQRAITPENVSALGKRLGAGEIDMNGGVASAIRVLGEVIRTPSRILTGTDEFFKQINFRSHAYNVLLSDELGRVGSANFDLAVRNAEKQMDQLIYKHQMVNESVLLQRHLDELDPADFATEFERKARAIELARQEWTDTSIMRKLAAEDAKRVAEEVTFTNPINPEGTALERLAVTTQQAVESVPILRLFMPFIRTPFNIVQWAGHRTVDPWIGSLRRFLDTALPGDLGKLELGKTKNRYLRDLMAPDMLRASGDFTPEAMRIAIGRQQEATGRLAVGIGMTATFATMAANGKITGAGPKDREQRELLRATGWQPYSIRIGNSYLEYRRLDPFATVLGSIADMYDVARLTPPDERGPHTVLGAIGIAIANNATNKTYMTGLRLLVDGILSGDGAKMQRVLLRYAGSLIPSAVADAGNFLAGGDPVMRETRGILDALVNRAPYLGDELDPVRNFLGEPVRKIQSVWSESSNGVTDLFLPLAYREVSDDLVNNEVAALGHGFMPPRRNLGGVDLTTFRNAKGQSAYDRMLELRGSVRVGGKTLRRALRELIRSRRYQSMDPISTHEAESPRIREVNAVIDRYHRRAKRELYREFPGVRSEIDRVRRETLQRRNVGVLERLTPR